MLAALLDKSLLKLGDKRVMTSGQAARTDHMHVVVDRHAGYFCRGLEKTTDVNVETQVRKARSDDFSTAVVAILAHLGDQDPGVSALVLRELLDLSESFLVLVLTLISGLLK